MYIIKIFSFEFTLVEFYGLLISIIGIIAGVLLVVVPRMNDRKRKINNLYRVVWKKTNKLKPDDIFGGDIYRYKKDISYFYRNIDNVIKEKIVNGLNILIVGKPLAGKTRAIYQNLKDLKKYVLVPLDNAKLDEIVIPKASCYKKRKVIIFDNLQNFLERDRPEKRETALEEFVFKLKKENIQIITSCRSGFELDLLKHKIDTNVIIETDENIINIPTLEKTQAKKILEKEWKQSIFPDSFDGTIGSLILPLKVMHDRFSVFTESEKNILVALKILYITGIYDEKGLFLTNRIKLLVSTEELNIPIENFQTYLGNLESKEFIKVESYKKIKAKDVYLEKIVKAKYNDYLDVFHDIIKVFHEDAEALFRCGSKAYSISIIIEKRLEYLEISIKAYENALKINTLKNSPLNYAVVHNNLGIAYATLAEAKEPESNCLKAIEAYEKALKIYESKGSVFDYAETQNNLGNAYAVFAEVKEPEFYYLEAIKAYKEVVNIYNLKDYPFIYAKTQRNLGIAYGNLAESIDKRKNYFKAIEAYEEALKVFKDDNYLFENRELKQLIEDIKNDLNQ